jgi:hypothetical protein
MVIESEVEKRRVCVPAIVSVVLGIVAVPVAAVSLHRISTVQSPSFQTCLISETPVYRGVHSLCAILPASSVTAGILGLMRMVRRRGRLRGKGAAIGGIVLSAAVLGIYWYILVHLTSGHVH